MDGFITFSKNIILNQGTNQVVFRPDGTGTTVTVNTANPVSNTVVTIPDPLTAAANFVLSQGAQTIVGQITFSNAIKLTKSTNQIVLQPGGSGNTVTIHTGTPSSSTVISIPDPITTTANFLISEGNQIVNGGITFTAATTFAPAGGQIRIKPGGSGNEIVLTTTNPAATRAYTLIDAGADAAFVMTRGTQTLIGSMTFSSAVKLTPSTNQIVFQPGGSGN